MGRGILPYLRNTDAEASCNCGIENCEHTEIEADANEDMSRRKALKVLATGAVCSYGSVNVVASQRDEPPEHSIDDFRVEGKKFLIRKDRKDHYEVTLRRQSPDLAQRYGDPMLEKTFRFEKGRWTQENTPSSGEVRVEIDNWVADIATEQEWERYFRENRDLGTRRDIDPMSVLPVKTAVADDFDDPERQDNEDQYPYPIWQYDEADDDIYEKTSPINIVLPLSPNPEECKTMDGYIEEKENAGWVSGTPPEFAQYTRYVWDRVDREFFENDIGAGTSWGRVNGGYHTRNYSFQEDEDDFDDGFHGRYIASQAHFDSRAPHIATGYKCAKHEVEEIFRDAFNWFVYEDYFDLDNEDGDTPDGCTTSREEGVAYHNGYASAITWNECSNVGDETDHHHENTASDC